MLVLNKISVEEYNNYYANREYITINEVPSWFDANKINYECIGIYDDSELVGVSLVRFYKKYAKSLVTCSLKDINEIKDALKKHYNNLIYFRIICSINIDKKDIVKINNVTYQKLYLDKSIDLQYNMMNSNAIRNIKNATNNGVSVDKIGLDDISRVEKIMSTDNGRLFDKSKISNIIDYYGYNAVIYVAYVEKQDVIKVIKNKINQVQLELDDINKKIVNGTSIDLGNKKDIVVKRLVKYQSTLKRASNLSDKQDIGALIVIYGDDNVYEVELGIDDAYKEFSPVYALYNTLIKEAISSNYKSIIFNEYLGIINESDIDSGIFTVRKNLGSKVIKTLGMYDIPIKKILYKIIKKNSGE